MDKVMEKMTLEELESGMEQANVRASVAITDIMRTLVHAAVKIPNMRLDTGILRLSVTDDEISALVTLSQHGRVNPADHMDDGSYDYGFDEEEEHLREF